MVRIKDMITKYKFYDLKQILSFSTIRKYMDTSEEILYFDTEAYRIKQIKLAVLI